MNISTIQILENMLMNIVIRTDVQLMKRLLMKMSKECFGDMQKYDNRT